MKVILDLALSEDGFIAKLDGDSDWVSERTEKLFKERIVEAGCLVVGWRTFDQYRGSIYPVEGVLNIVLTSTHPNEKADAHVVFATSVEEAMQIATERKCSGILIAGGSLVAKAFLEKDLIDEIYFSVHPLQLGIGIRPFADMPLPQDIDLIDSHDLGEGIHQDHYKVRK